MWPLWPWTMALVLEPLFVVDDGGVGREDGPPRRIT